MLPKINLLYQAALHFHCQVPRIQSPEQERAWSEWNLCFGFGNCPLGRCFMIWSNNQVYHLPPEWHEY